MKNIILKFGILLLAFFTVSSANAFADVFVWNAENVSCSGEWTDADCWDDDLGSPKNSVPGASDDVYFIEGSGDCIIPDSATVSVASINSSLSGSFYDGTLVNETTETISFSNIVWNSPDATASFIDVSVNVSGNVTISSGLVNFTNTALTINGAFNGSGGTATFLGGSTMQTNSVNISGATVSAENSIGAWIVNTTFVLSAGTFSASEGDLWVKGNFNQSGGTFNMLGDMEVDGSFTLSNGTFNMGPSILRLDGSTTISGTGKFIGEAYDGTLDVNGNFTISSSLSFDSPYYTKIGGSSFITFRIDVNGLWNASEGSTVEFDCDANVTVRFDNLPSPATQFFENVKINMTGANNTFSFWSSHVMRVRGDLELISGTMGNIGKFEVEGSVNIASEIKVTATVPLLIELVGEREHTSFIHAGATLPRFRINNPNATLKYAGSDLNSQIHFRGDFTVSAGLFTTDFEVVPPDTAGNLQVLFSGNVLVNGGVFDLVKADTQVALNSSSTSDFTISSGTANFDMDEAIFASFTQNGGTVNLNSTNIKFGRNFYLNGGVFNEGTSTVTVSDLSTNHKNIGVVGTQYFYDFEVDFTASVLFETTSGSSVRVLNDLRLLNGQFSITTNTFYYVYNPSNFVYGANFIGQNSSRGNGSIVFIADQNDLSVEIGQLNGTGMKTLPGIQLDNNGFDNFSFSYTGTNDAYYAGTPRIFGSSGAGTKFYASTKDVNLEFQNALTIQGGEFYTGKGGVIFRNSVNLSAGSIIPESSLISFVSSANLNLSGTGIFDASQMPSASVINYINLYQHGGTYLGGVSDVNFAYDLDIRSGVFNSGTGEYLVNRYLYVNNTSSALNNAVVDFSNSNLTVIGQNTSIGRSGSSGSFKAPGAGKFFDIYRNPSFHGATLFDVNNGTIRLLGSSGSSMSFSVTVPAFNNFIINKDLGVNVSFSRAIVEGDFKFLSGTCTGAARIDVLGTFEYGENVSGTCFIEFVGNEEKEINLISGRSYPNLNNINPNMVINAPVDGNVTLQGINIYNGVFRKNGANLTVLGNYYQNGGSFDGVTNDNGGVVNFTGGSGELRIVNGSFLAGSSSYNFANNLKINDFSSASAFVDFSDATVFVGNSFNIGSVSTLGEVRLPSNGKELKVMRSFSRVQTANTIINPGTGRVVLEGSGSGSFYIPAFYDLEVNKASGVAVFLQATSSVNDLIIKAGNVSLNVNNFYVSGNLEIDNSLSNFTTSTTTNVILTGGDQSLKGDFTFRHLRKPHNSSIIFEAGSTTTILGTWEAKGGSQSERLELKSSVAGQEWFIDPQGTRDLAYLDVQDSNNINATLVDVRGTGSVEHFENPNNSNWLFDSAPSVFNLGPSNLLDGSIVYSKRPSFEFEIDDANDENVSFQIQITNVLDAGVPDYSSSIVDFSSIYEAEGEKSFILGVDLPEGNYYWRVRAVNELSGLTSAWVYARSADQVAFTVEYASVGVVLQSSPKNNIQLGTFYPTFRWQAIDNSEIKDYVIEIAYMSDSKYENIIETIVVSDYTAENIKTETRYEPGFYRWRIYTVDYFDENTLSLIVDETGETLIDARYQIINIVPEYNVYIYLLTIMSSFVFLYMYRQKIFSLNHNINY